MKMKQREMVVRYLAQNMGKWIPGHELVKNASQIVGGDYIIQDADTRAHELSREGKFSSPNYNYFIEHRKNGKYAEFRCAFKTPKETYALKDWTFGQPQNNYSVQR